jgi:phage-related protein
MTSGHTLKVLIWLGSSRRDFVAFPDDVKSEMGYALFQAQAGGRHRKAKPLRGAGDAGVIEIIDDHRGDTFRTIYTVRYANAVYVLHAFQKKSKSGIATPKSDLDLVEQRLREAARLHKETGK